jgi:hypothetical protein
LQPCRDVPQQPACDCMRGRRSPNPNARKRSHCCAAVVWCQSIKKKNFHPAGRLAVAVWSVAASCHCSGAPPLPLCNVSTAAPLRSSGHVCESVSLAPRNVRVFFRSSPASCETAELAICESTEILFLRFRV